MRTRFCPRKVIFVISLLLVSLLSPLPAQGQDNNPTRRETPALNLIIMVDESGSMWNTTDTAGVRANTVDLLIDLLSSVESDPPPQVAIIAFGSTPRVIPYTLLDSPAAAEALKEQFAALHQEIRAVKDHENTDINLALQSALALLKQANDSARKPALILLSDGQPATREVGEKKGKEVVEAYLNTTRGLLDHLKAYPYVSPTCASPNGAPVYMVGIGVDQMEDATPEFITLYREFWQEGAANSGGYYKEAEKIQEMQGLSTYIFSELLCAPATPAQPVRSPQVLEYQVYDNYYQIFFTISGKENPKVQAQVYRPAPDGSLSNIPLGKNEPGVSWQSGTDYEVWGVRFSEPWAGTWQVALEGEGRADFSYVFFPKVGLRLIEPNSNFLPVDKPFAIRANIVDENGQPVDIPLKEFQVEVDGNDFRQQLSLEKQNGSYAAKLDPLKQTGEYALTFQALLPDGTPLYEHKWVTLISAPWVDVTEPGQGESYTPAEAIPVQADVHQAGAVSFEDTKLVATLLKDGQSVKTIELSQDDSSSQGGENVMSYTGEFPPAEQNGDYEVQVKLMAVLPGGRVFDQETAPMALSVMLPTTATPLPTVATSSPTVTSTPTPTPVPTATFTPSPAPTVTPTPTPMSFWASATSAPWCLPVGIGLPLLVLLLALLLWWRRRRRNMPEKIKLLTELMRSRRDNNEAPYVLVIGSGPAVTLGSSSMDYVVKAVAGTADLDKYYKTLDSLSAMERYVILKKYFAEAGVSSGYRHLAQLVKKGYFNVVLTTNLDPFLENALADGKMNGLDVIVCGEKLGNETLDLPNNTSAQVKLFKLHGDVEARSFAFTPSEITMFGTDSERILRHFLSRDVIIIGHGPRDYDINRAIEREGGSIWYVNQSPPVTEDPIYHAMRARKTQANVITGEFGVFDHFFDTLFEELGRS